MTGGTGAPLLGPRKTPESRSTGPRRSSGRLEGSLRELEEALPEASEPSARSSRVLPGSTKRRVGPTLAGPPGRAARAPSSGPRGPESGSSGEASRRRGELACKSAVRHSAKNLLRAPTTRKRKARRNAIHYKV